MASRMEKYFLNESDSSSRSARNKKLYDDIYNTGVYSNSVVLDDSKEIDIDKIKEILDREKKLEEKKVSRPTIDLYKELSNIKDDAEEKIYDINEVLKDAKNKRNILEEASEKKKIYENKYGSHLDLEEELAKTRKVYDKLLQEETELLDIMNTLTNGVMNMEESYKDLTTDANKYNTGKVNTQKINVVNEDKEDTEYSTNTFMFDKRDFVSKEIDDELNGTNKFIKLLVFLITIAVILGAYYVITTYILK